MIIINQYKKIIYKILHKLYKQIKSINKRNYHFSKKHLYYFNFLKENNSFYVLSPILSSAPQLYSPLNRLKLGKYSVLCLLQEIIVIIKHKVTFIVEQVHLKSFPNLCLNSQYQYSNFQPNSNTTYFSQILFQNHTYSGMSKHVVLNYFTFLRSN